MLQDCLILLLEYYSAFNMIAKNIFRFIFYVVAQRPVKTVKVNLRLTLLFDNNLKTLLFW